jgi:hypothetical protein
MKYLIDTSAWVLALRSDGDKSAVDAVADALANNQAAICPIVMLELLSGVKAERHYRELESELRALYFIAATDSVWAEAYRLGHALRKKGVTIPAADVLVAAAALSEDCAVLHRDRHFDLISKHTGLKSVRV